MKKILIMMMISLSFISCTSIRHAHSEREMREIYSANGWNTSLDRNEDDEYIDYEMEDYIKSLPDIDYNKVSYEPHYNALGVALDDNYDIIYDIDKDVMGGKSISIAEYKCFMRSDSGLNRRLYNDKFILQFRKGNVEISHNNKIIDRGYLMGQVKIIEKINSLQDTKVMILRDYEWYVPVNKISISLSDAKEILEITSNDYKKYEKINRTAEKKLIEIKTQELKKLL